MRHKNWIKLGKAGVQALFIACLIFVCPPSTALSASATSKGKTKAAQKADAGEKKTASGLESGQSETPERSKNKTATPRKRSRSARAESSPITDVTSSTTGTLPVLIDKLIANAGASRWGVKVDVAETGEIIYKKNPSHLFVPASNRKLFTGALALDLLGPNFQYHTYLFRTGKVDASGVLNGNLVIKPQGDPTFSNTIVRNAPTDWIFRDWVTKVQAEGIKSVAGELVVDCSDWNMMDLTPKGWPTRIKSDYYAPQSSPLTLNENIIEIRVKPSAAGQPGIIEFIPPAEGYPIVNKTVTGAGKGGISVNREADGHIEVTGAPSTRSTGQTYAVPCDNPTLFAAAVLRHHLHQAGIEIRGAVRILTTKSSSSAPRPENIIAVYISPSMAEIVKTMMKHSNNHFAEQLYISLSAIKSQAGGYRTSKQLENEFLARAGINTRELNFEDGCGLSLLNQVSPHHICQLLNYMMRHPAWPAFFDSLPVAGRDGTLRGRMRNDNIAQKVHAKTGFVNQVSALSGYLTLNQGRTLVFSFLVNDVHSSTGAVKSAEDHLCEILSLLSL